MEDPDTDSAALLEKYRTDPDKYLYCIDWKKVGDKITIWGSQANQENYQRLEFVLVPCNYVHSYYGYEGDFIADGCIADLTKQVEYLNNMRMLVYTEEKQFNVEKFGDETFTSYSKFFEVQVDPSKPSWVGSYIM